VPYVLIADDDELLCELLRFKLEAAGFRLTIVSDGAAALESATATVPDMVILDSMMPIVTGPEVLRALKASDRTAAVPVIMLTARKGEADIVEALRGGAVDYLTKPFLPEELVARIAAVLGRKVGDHARKDVA